jgi:hypothetical protein
VPGELRGRWRQATRAVMVLLSLHGLPSAQIAELLDCHPATVRRAVVLAGDETQAHGPTSARTNFWLRHCLSLLHHDPRTYFRFEVHSMDRVRTCYGTPGWKLG